MSIPIPISRAGAGISSRTLNSSNSNPIEDNRTRLLELASRAPVIGSLPGPLNDLPGLDLPPASPDSVSLAAILTADTTRRLVGVSSAPARSFMENARRARAALGTSPTVLSILEQQAKASIGNTNKVSYSGLFATTGGSSLLQQSISESALSAATGFDTDLEEFKEATPGRREYSQEGVHGLKNRRELAIGSLPSGGSKLGGGYRMNLGGSSTHVVPVLATSFRDPSEMPMALPEDFEGNSEDDDSADEAIIRKSSSKGGRSSKFVNNNDDDDDEEDDDEDKEHVNEKRRSETNLKKSLSENEGGVFGEGLED